MLLLKLLPPFVRRRPFAWALVAVCLLAYLPAILAVALGAYPFDDDALGLSWPWRAWLRDQIAHGILPGWNPLLFCGQSTRATAMSLLFYPPNWVLWPLSPPWAALWSALFHNLLLLFGAYVLGRVWGLGKSASFVVACLMGLSGSVVAHLYTGHDTWHASRAYIPWQLAATLLFLRSGQKCWIVRLAALFGLQFLAGYPPLVLLSGGGCLLLALGRIGERLRTQNRPFLPKNWLLALVAVPLAAGILAAVGLLPFREISGFSVHAIGMNFEEATSVSASWKSFFRLFAPDFFGGNAPLQWSAPISPHEEAASVGLLGVVLALAAPILAWRTRQDEKMPRGAWFLGLLLPFSALLAIGNHSPLYHFLWEHSAFWRALRVPARWMEVWAIVLPLLTGWSFEFLGRERQKIVIWPRILGALAAIFGAATVLVALGPENFWRSHQGAQWNRQWIEPSATLARQIEMAAELRQNAILGLMTAAILAALAAALLARWQRAQTTAELRLARTLLVGFLVLDVLMGFWKGAHFVVPSQLEARYFWPSDLVAYWQEGTRWTTKVPMQSINAGMFNDVPLFNGYDPLSSERFYQFASQAEGQKSWQGGVYQPKTIGALLRVAGVTHTLSQNVKIPKNPAQGEVGAWKLLPHYQGEARVWPLFYFTTRIYRLPEAAQLLALTQLATPPPRGAPPVVVGPDWPQKPAKTASFDGLVRVERRDSDQITLDLPQNVPAGALVHSETRLPGWRAWVDGVSTPLESGNFLFRAVPTPRGAKKVDLVYDSQTFRFGLFVSLCGLMGLTALVARKATR